MSTITLPNGHPLEYVEVGEGGRAQRAELGVDFVALSFVRAAADVRDLQAIIRQHGSATSREPASTGSGSAPTTPPDPRCC